MSRDKHLVAVIIHVGPNTNIANYLEWPNRFQIGSKCPNLCCFGKKVGILVWSRLLFFPILVCTPMFIPNSKIDSFSAIFHASVLFQAKMPRAESSSPLCAINFYDDVPKSEEWQPPIMFTLLVFLMMAERYLCKTLDALSNCEASGKLLVWLVYLTYCIVVVDDRLHLRNDLI